MARKNVFGDALKSALKETGNKATSPAPSADQPAEESAKRVSPNVRYFSQSFEEQMKRSLQDIDPNRIDMSRFSDRIDPGEDLEELEDSIRRNGQQVPVLVRRKADDRFEAVYGRRRILVCRKLGRPVRGMVVDLGDEDALVAQGLENAARLENSYIERALFVKDILDAGFTAVLVEKAIGVEETQVYRMRGIARDIPADIIRKVGAAHGIGRRPWEELRKLLNAPDAPNQNALAKKIRQDLPSPERLKRLIADLKSDGKAQVPSGDRDIVPGHVFAKRTRRALTVRTAEADKASFLEHLEKILPDLYKDWASKEG